METTTKGRVILFTIPALKVKVTFKDPLEVSAFITHAKNIKQPNVTTLVGVLTWENFEIIAPLLSDCLVIEKGSYAYRIEEIPNAQAKTQTNN